MACSSATLCAANPAAQISGINRNAARQRIAGAPSDCAATIIDSRPARRRSIVRAFKKASAGRGQIQHAARDGVNAIVSSDELQGGRLVDRCADFGGDRCELGVIRFWFGAPS
ncbi:hypothetical protein [Burkholderia ubonensis]|uniref:hypothetical protein n=1 Tax=Burkholderia ubonensis TaxID=101571 RepID=UPI0012FCDAD0|nr:hypothetical protein [Burkholderia ubonensis]